jgi:N-acetylglucosaminyl-diphospho-decaprenol L-rhamnosyltransferase
MPHPQARIDISIVIINWNVARLLDGCLASIFQGTEASDSSVEVIVVDNGSDERDYRQVVENHPVDRLIELETNLGYGAACNAGAAAARGEALLLLNPDTFLLPGSLDLLWNTMQIAPHIGLVAPMLLNRDGTLQSAGYRFPGVANLLFDLLPLPARLYESPLNGRIHTGNGELPYAIDYALGAALMIRRSAFEQVGGFDESYFMYSEEVDLQRRLADAGWTRLLAPAARIIHLGGQSTSQRPADMEAALWQCRARYLQRWSSPGQHRLEKLAVRAATAIDDRRNPSNRIRNRHIRGLFSGGNAG